MLETRTHKKKLNCILLIDDNQYDIELHSKSIMEADVCHHLATAEGGSEGLSYLAKSIETDSSGSFLKPDLIFLDINMPAMDGFEFLKEFNRIKWQFPDTQIIMLSGSKNPSDKTNSVKEFDISDYLYKPLTAENVKNAIMKHF